MIRSKLTHLTLLLFIQRDNAALMTGLHLKRQTFLQIVYLNCAYKTMYTDK